MNWVDLDLIDMMGNGAILTISHIDMVDFSETVDILRRHESCEDAGELLCEVRQLIRHHRPELADCSVHSMRFDVCRREWQIGVMHPSLRPTAPGGQLPKLPLVSRSRTAATT